ncbi:MAG: HlyC/CorC family transporter [Planctomycetaceae bacterium]|jgi:CBS domain containing-hemolysin-like protein|nr:HlyC/CorC family transporter [Planctomycetaceae bacterium]MBT6153378.1 HlyC/CorC family transporter [Planctomycetaceae bacterium]MBT6484027.1 HlyC/CorC family transporter [Planctomycetaceae bacterium]MBT6497028.1 HlyC/CorC family transporter [Planctomycetaceae bacterium]
MPAWLANSLDVLIAIVLVLLNGFFVAAEFALVKVRGTRVHALVKSGRPFASTASWLVERMDGALSACQLGITIASLALGWVAEEAFHGLLMPVFEKLGIAADVSHIIALVIAFTLITSLHLVIGEQAPKIFAIRRPETMLLWCAMPLKMFYLCTFPLMTALNKTTSYLLRFVGIQGGSEHDTPHTEDEIRALVHQASAHGELTSSEQQLIHRVFEFDDMVCRHIMVPRGEVEFFDINKSINHCIAQLRRTKHTRYPVCDGSLDNVLGIVHVKDLIGLDLDESFEWKSIMRPPRKMPENIPISKVLRQFQATHQLMALVIDEYGTVIGVVTLENVLEQIIGEVEDEFDVEQPSIVPDGPDQWIVQGSAPVDEVVRKLKISPAAADVDTFSGLLTHRAERLLNPGDRIELDGLLAEIMEVRDDRAVRVRVSRST